MRAAFASRYLLGISGYILLLTITQTFVYFQELRIVQAQDELAAPSRTFQAERLR